MCCVYPVIFVAVMAVFQAAPRDKPAAPPERGTAVVGGRVTDKESGAPLAGVTVMLQAAHASRSEGARFTSTTDDGRYRFTDVTAGSYVLAADTGEHRPTHILQTHGDSSFRSMYGARPTPKPIDVKDGDVRENLHIAMSRALAIAGTVVNHAGEPMANVPVQARALVHGRTFSGGPNRTTDDRGAFRLFGLPPGRYLLCTQMSSYVASEHARPERLVPTCHPAAVREEDATVVLLAGADVIDVQIRMQQMRPVRLSGTVLDSTGAPAAHAMVNVESRERLARFAGEAIVRNGQFTVAGLLPGEYRLLAHAPGPDANDFQKGELGSLTVRLDAADLDGVVIPMAKAAKVAGHLVFEDGVIPPMPQYLNVRTMFAAGSVSAKPAPVRDDLTFALEGLFGPQLLDVVNVPSGWILKSVRHNGVDITDTPVAFATSSDPRALQITLTTRSAALSGRVVDDRGQPVTGARVFLFPADPERRGRGLSGDSSSGDDGAFAIRGQRAGEYLIVAVHEDEAPRFDERGDLDIIAKAAERVSLYEGEGRSITLRLAKLRESR